MLSVPSEEIEMRWEEAVYTVLSTGRRRAVHFCARDKEARESEAKREWWRVEFGIDRQERGDRAWGGEDEKRSDY